MSDDADAHFERHEEILRGFTALLVKMDGYLTRQDAINERLQEFNGHQVAINLDTKATLARMETLLTQMLRHEDTGR